MNTAPPPPRTGADPVRPSGSVPITEGPAPARGRWIWVAACGVVAIVAMLGVAAAVTSVSDRQHVLAVAHDVPAGAKLKKSDLVVADVADDPALKPVSADRRQDLVGRYTTVGLRAGSLLTGSQTSRHNGLSAGKQMVGVEAKRGQLPAKALAPGDKVLVVPTPGKDGAVSSSSSGSSGSGDKGGDDPITGTVASVSGADASGAVVVNLAVSNVDGTELATRAASGDVALVRQPGS